jgi:hypothetical protein
MKKKIGVSLLIILIIMMLVLTGCGKKLTSGEIYEKEFLPEHTTTMILPVYFYNGKGTTMILIPYIYYYPDRWVVKIKDFQGDEWTTEDYYIPEELYDQIIIGGEFEYDSDRDLDDEPYTRKKKD